MALRGIFMLILVQLTQIYRRHDGRTFSELSHCRKCGTFCDYVIASVNVLFLVDATVCADQKNRKFFNHLTQVFISNHAHPVLFDRLLKLIVLDLKHHNLRFQVIEYI